MNTKRTDFQEVIENLVSVGMTNMDIAKEIGIPQASISHLRTGVVKDPRYSVGKKLMAIHTREMRAYRKRMSK
jgi:predicted transcriptional regulator